MPEDPPRVLRINQLRGAVRVQRLPPTPPGLERLTGSSVACQKFVVSLPFPIRSFKSLAPEKAGSKG